MVLTDNCIGFWSYDDDGTDDSGNDGANPYNLSSDIFGAMGLWNRKLTLAEVNELYNSGNGYNSFGVGGGTPINNAIFFRGII